MAIALFELCIFEDVNIRSNLCVDSSLSLSSIYFKPIHVCIQETYASLKIQNEG